MTGKYYAKRKTVTFESNNDNKNIQLEYCHNLIIQTKPDTNNNKEDRATDAMLMASLIDDLNNRITTDGASALSTQ
jgi:hypothetical protein